MAEQSHGAASSSAGSAGGEEPEMTQAQEASREIAKETKEMTAQETEKTTEADVEINAIDEETPKATAALRMILKDQGTRRLEAAIRFK